MTPVPERTDGLWSRVRQALFRPRGNRMWDAVIRGTGVAGLLTALLWNVDNLLAELLGRRAAAYTRVRYRDFVSSPRDTVLRLLREADSNAGFPITSARLRWS